MEINFYHGFAVGYLSAIAGYCLGKWMGKDRSNKDVKRSRTMVDYDLIKPEVPQPKRHHWKYFVHGYWTCGCGQVAHRNGIDGNVYQSYYPTGKPCRP